MIAPALLEVTKGHGTQNDFVLIDDRRDEIDLSAELVRALTDRRSGVGGDGVIRLAPSTSLPEGEAVLAEDASATWFMDYRNADGSAAEMCGNGIRVFVRFLERLGLVDAGAAEVVVGTRAGVRRVRREPNGWYAVDMGRWTFPGGESAVARGFDAEVRVTGLDVDRPALRVDVGNPHTVLALPGLAELAAAELVHAPTVSPTPARGTNVELVVPLGEASDGHGGTVGRVRMRVHERGVGETRSCGTGACAAALAVRSWGGPTAPDSWLVDVPGGTVRVRVRGSGTVELAGPAVLVATAQVDLAALLAG
ncbi:diaminopimelate epimerase [mine drainage metagenome]|uniref:diaminopimelate epimerase n=1 Tax=mine drainage metagenome TaxID=410659 RepID=A0A1J5R6T7_9ZZZZ